MGRDEDQALLAALTNLTVSTGWQAFAERASALIDKAHGVALGATASDTERATSAAEWRALTNLVEWPAREIDRLRDKLTKGASDG